MPVISSCLPALPLNRRQALIGGAGAAASLLLPQAAMAQTRLQITEGTVAPMPIALPNFVAGTPADAEVGQGVAQVITNNLKRSGLFAPIDQAAYIEKISNIDVPPQFPSWKTINAQALVTGRMTRQPDGRLKAEFRLWDVAAGQQLTGQQYFTSPEYWRRIAHIISDQIYERLTGEKGYFDSRVVFIDETGSKERRVKRLALMDQDGANVRYLTRGSDLVLTPRFSPTTQEITYMEFGQGDPRVYLFNIETGQREIVGNFPGMSFSPRFSPDGQRIIMSMQQGGNSNLFVMDLRSKSTTRLTDTPAIDTSPSYAPDGSRICFESDRGGKQQIYVMPAGRRRRAAHLVRRRQLLDAGVVAARRLHRLHQAGRRPVLDRHHEARRLRRAAVDLGLPQRGPDLRAQRPGADVLPRSRRRGRAVALHGGYFRPQRAEGADPRICLRPGLVAAAVVKSYLAR